MKKFDPGKWAEAEVVAWLEAKSAASTHLAYHRLPDARAARGALAAQPADVQVVNRGVFSYLEVKETKLTTRLPRIKVRQWPTLKKWHWAGATSWVLVYRSTPRDWVILDARDLFDYDDTPTSFPFDGLATYPTAAAALQEIYK